MVRPSMPKLSDSCWASLGKLLPFSELQVSHLCRRAGMKQDMEKLHKLMSTVQSGGDGRAVVNSD